MFTITNPTLRRNRPLTRPGVRVWVPLCYPPYTHTQPLRTTSPTLGCPPHHPPTQAQGSRQASRPSRAPGTWPHPHTNLTDMPGDRAMGQGSACLLGPTQAAFIPTVNGFCMERAGACPGPNPPRACEAKLDPWGESLQRMTGGKWWQTVPTGPQWDIVPASPGLSPASRDLRGLCPQPCSQLFGTGAGEAL